MKLTTEQALTLSKLIVVEILDHGLKDSTFRDMHDEAYKEILRYRSNLENSVFRVLRRIKL